MKAPRGLELTVLASLLFMILSGVYSYTQSRRLAQAEEEARNTHREIRDILALKALWDDRNLPEKARKIRSLLRPEQIEDFTLKKRKLEMKTRNLSGRDLNRLMGKLGALPLRIRTLKIQRSGDRYRLECQCKW